VNAIRRLLWILIFLAGLPGVLVGLVTGYGFIVLPVVFLAGLAVARSETMVGFSFGVFVALVLGYIFGLGLSIRSNYWPFFLWAGSSALLALLATFKVGMMLRLRVWGRRRLARRNVGA
jgi:hypothetical protein